MKLKLTGRFVLILLAVGLTPLLVLAALSLRATGRIAQGTASALQQSAVGTLDTIERNLFERYGDVQAFATNHVLFSGDPAANQADRARLTDAINTYVRLYGLYSLSMVTDAAGKVVAVNTLTASGKPIDTSFLIGRDFSRASWFEHARDGKFLSTDLLNGTVVEDVARDPDVVRVFGERSLTISYSAPIKNPRGEFIGVWRNLADFSLIVEEIIRESWRGMNAKGMGTCEFILASADGVLLSHYTPTHTGTEDLVQDLNAVLRRNVAAEISDLRRAVDGKSGTGRYYDTEESHWHLTGFAKSQGALGYAGLGWALLVQGEENDLLSEVISANRATYLTVGVSLLVLLAVAFVVARSITKPLFACADAVRRLSEGDLTARVELRRGDELGALADTINTSVGNLRQLIGQLNDTATTLFQSAQNLSQTAQTQAASAEETTAQAHTVASAGEELSVNAKSMAESAAKITQSTGTVASAMEEMSSSIQEVARNCAQESEIAQKADAQARQTRDLMARLDESARQINKVVELIHRIAEQTNLLALNATIEAASAGEAGRGFAVVANEVKELARQSAAATEDIRKQVALIQDGAGSSMRSLDEVAKVIEQVSHIASSIAAAVEQQSATTSEIVGTIHNVSTASGGLSQNVQQAAEGATEVARNIAGVSQAAADGAQVATRVSASATELQTISANLGQLVGRFRL